MSQLTHEQAMKGLNRALELARAANRPDQSRESIDEILDRVFVSPRIVDQTAYEDWSGRLRQLITEMSAQQRTVANATNEFKALESQVKDATRGLQAKMELALRVVPTLDQRISRAEEALAGPPSRATGETKAVRPEFDRAQLMKLVEEFATTSAQRMLAEQTGAFVKQLEERARATEAQLNAKISAIDDAAEKAQARALQLINRQLTQLERAKESALAEIAARAEEHRRAFSLQAEAGTQRADEAARHAAIACQGAIAGAEGAASRSLSEIAHAKTLAMGEFTARATHETQHITTLGAQAVAAVTNASDSHARAIGELTAQALAKLDHTASTTEATIRQLAANAVSTIEAAAAKIGSHVGEQLRADAAALGAAADHAAQKLGAIREETNQSLTRAAGAISSLTGEARDTVRTSAEVATERAKTELGEFIATRRDALIAGVDEATKKLGAIREETNQSLTRAAGAISSLTGEARETVRTSAEVAAERARTEVADFIAARREALALTARNAEDSLVGAEVRATRTLEQLEHGAGRAEAALRKAEGFVKELETAVARAGANGQRSLDILAGSLDERIGAASARAEVVLARAATLDIDTLEHAAQGAEAATAKALNSVSHLNASLARAEELRTQVEQSMRDLAEMRRQAEFARKQLAETVLREADRIDNISTQLARLPKP